MDDSMDAVQYIEEHHAEDLVAAVRDFRWPPRRDRRTS
jgi:hypothetical protein